MKFVVKPTVAATSIAIDVTLEITPRTRLRYRQATQLQDYSLPANAEITPEDIGPEKFGALLGLSGEEMADLFKKPIPVDYPYSAETVKDAVLLHIEHLAGKILTSETEKAQALTRLSEDYRDGFKSFNSKLYKKYNEAATALTKLDDAMKDLLSVEIPDDDTVARAKVVQMESVALVNQFKNVTVKALMEDIVKEIPELELSTHGPTEYVLSPDWFNTEYDGDICSFVADELFKAEFGYGVSEMLTKFGTRAATRYAEFGLIDVTRQAQVDSILDTINTQRAEKERRMWVECHGSAQLKEVEAAGYNTTRQYRTERVQQFVETLTEHLHPCWAKDSFDMGKKLDFRIDWAGKASKDPRMSPSVSYVRLEKVVESLEPQTTHKVVFRGDDKKSSDVFGSHDEALLVSGLFPGAPNVYLLLNESLNDVTVVVEDLALF